MSRAGRDVILTGIPRGGTTLAAALLDGLEDAACLSEPPFAVELQQRSSNAAEFVEALEEAFLDIRAKLLRGDTIIDRRRPDGSATTNYFAVGQSKRSADYAEMARTAKNLTSNCVVGVKHNALFASVLPEIMTSRRLEVIAIVRHPVSVLASWSTLDLPVSRGRLPAADKYWPGLNDKAAARPSLLRTQVSLYNSLAERFISCGVRLVRYEDLVKEPEVFLRSATGRPSAPPPQSVTIAPKGPEVVDPSRAAEIREAIRQEYAADGASAIAALYPSAF